MAKQAFVTVHVFGNRLADVIAAPGFRVEMFLLGLILPGILPTRSAINEKAKSAAIAARTINVFTRIIKAVSRINFIALLLARGTSVFVQRIQKRNERRNVRGVILIFATSSSASRK